MSDAEDDAFGTGPHPDVEGKSAGRIRVGDLGEIWDEPSQAGRHAAHVVAAQAAAEAAQARADRLAARVKTLQRVDQAAQRDPFPEGTALRIRWNEYTFLALKIRGVWYTTGRAGPHQATWRAFVEWLAAAETLVVTQMVPQGVHHLFGDGS